jgi:ribosome-associated translation inhibitor RaiA
MRTKILGTERNLTTEEKGLIERHVQFALSRFDGLVQRAVVAVQDGLDSKECHIQLSLRSGLKIAASERHGDLATATRTAAQRAANALDRHVNIQRPERATRSSAGMQFGD